MKFGRNGVRSAIISGLLAVSAVSVTLLPPVTVQAASEVKAVVNGQAITSGDVASRVAFLRLQHRSGNLNKTALDQLVEEALKRQEIARVGASVSTSDVDAAFARFAASNKMDTKRMAMILDKSGVGVSHFKSFIAVQMSWPRLLSARYGSSGQMSKQDIISRMAESKEKPSTTEYFLKQIIFVIPESKRKSITGKRKAEAEASRKSFPGCEEAMQFARNYHDVSIRDLGRILEPQLPAEWKPLIEKASNGTTGTRVTDKGVEYLAICKSRTVSDDLAAEMVFRAEDIGKDKKKEDEDPNDKKYLDDLRSKAQIIYR
ncbi:peptidylprolyl isomerase [Rhizobium halophytocola]|uniref:Peptidyl-prolyl cis-trans isomerase SurA n=1 Tax=Rhizobium halophytocola TaxID=735519 RepID=A0ABS4DYH3_9HYPH|nr:peptidylprolyl isomerase [Rhizobium halophytocola]MBP1850747.1 peptidyl-prolyl cis-trans isomerase SurA [Rhizobium halophytocola]